MRVVRGRQGVVILFLARLAVERILHQRRLTILSDAGTASSTTGEKDRFRMTTSGEER